MTRPRGWILAGLGVTLVALFAHVWVYRFLTDDAFISFRYARNLAHGYGLVFNPGFERVEGYSNFLWVVGLALLDRLGLAPEMVANPLSLAATVALWWVVVRFTLRHRPPAGAEWMVLIPPAFLAVSRSFAVWSTSGLETRAFELLAVAGLLQLADEVDAWRRDTASAGPPWGSILLGLASLTRPDGALVAFCALGAAGTLVLLGPGDARTRLRAAVLRTWPAFAMVAVLYAFRIAYYHAWAPNTYYAKVSGVLRWHSGLQYLNTFLLEYAGLLWLPALVAVVVAWRHTARTPLVLLAAGIIPHVLYVIAIGGDHFEYRPLDLLFPCVAILLYEGARAVAGTARGRALAGALALLVLGGAFLLPWRSHVEAPRTYLPGFPGLQLSGGPILGDTEQATAARYLDPDHFAVTRLPGIRMWAEAHRHALITITSYFSGIRQEEHREFYELVTRQARSIRGAIDRGQLPRDLYVAMDCVGVIPYVTDFRTLDRLGLCDAHVAHQPFQSDYLAHGKHATFAYARERGVELWFFHPAQLILPAASSTSMRAFQPPPPGEDAAQVAPLDRDTWIVAKFPRGDSLGRARLPALHFWDTSDSLDVRAARAAAIEAWSASHASRPRDTEPLDALGFLHAEEGRFLDAAGDYRALAELTTDDPEPLANLAACLEAVKDHDGALAALRLAVERANALGDGNRARELSLQADRLAAGTRRR